MSQEPNSGAVIPECPWWCTETHCAAWDRGGGQLSRHCRRVVQGPDDSDGNPVEIELARFAACESGRVVVDQPTVTLAGGTLGVAAARLIAETLMRLVEISGEPAIVAA